MFIEQQISILEWFLKTGVMMLKIQLLMYIQIENSYFKL